LKGESIAHLENKKQQVNLDASEQKELEIINQEVQEHPPIDTKGSLIFQNWDTKPSKTGIDRIDLHEQICPLDSSFTYKQNAFSILNDLERALQVSYIYTQVIEYESNTSGLAGQFMSILDDFKRKGQKLLRAEQVLFFMLDQGTNELIKF